MINQYYNMVGKLCRHCLYPVTIWLEKYLPKEDMFKVVTVKGSQCQKFMTPQEIFENYTVMLQEATSRVQAIKLANINMQRVWRGINHERKTCISITQEG